MNAKTLLILPVVLMMGVACAKSSNSGLTGMAKKKKPVKTWAVLKITYYDGKSEYEILETKGLVVRARELWIEFPLWKAAHRAAKRQWSIWYSAKTPENRGRSWVLPKPRQPHLQQMGKFTDEIAAIDKVTSLKKALQKNRNDLAKRLWKSRGSSWPKMMYINNLEANGRVVREMIVQVRDDIIKKDRQFAKRMSETKKKQLWDKVHQAEYMAKREVIVRAKAKAKAKGQAAPAGDPDPLEVYNLSRKLVEPILARYKINEWQWFAIWEEGHLAGWKAPVEIKVAQR